MPLYDYRCGVCREVKEVYQSFSGEAPLCCGQPMDRLLSIPSLITVRQKGGTKVHSEGYKKGYAENYRRRQMEKGFIPTP